MKRKWPEILMLISVGLALLFGGLVMALSFAGWWQ
jgi:hypothetical protein